MMLRGAGGFFIGLTMNDKTEFIDVDLAKKVACSISDYFERSCAYMMISEAQECAGLFSDAKETIAQAREAIEIERERIATKKQNAAPIEEIINHVDLLIAASDGLEAGLGGEFAKAKTISGRARKIKMLLNSLFWNYEIRRVEE